MWTLRVVLGTLVATAFLSLGTAPATAAPVGIDGWYCQVVAGYTICRFNCAYVDLPLSYAHFHTYQCVGAPTDDEPVIHNVNELIQYVNSIAYYTTSFTPNEFCFRGENHPPDMDTTWGATFICVLIPLASTEPGTGEG